MLPLFCFWSSVQVKWQTQKCHATPITLNLQFALSLATSSDQRRYRSCKVIISTSVPVRWGLSPPGRPAFPCLCVICRSPVSLPVPVCWQSLASLSVLLSWGSSISSHTGAIMCHTVINEPGHMLAYASWISVLVLRSSFSIHVSIHFEPHSGLGKLWPASCLVL